ncbi:MAG: lysophospholipid acyltransferase family protein [Gemmatimonadaceae bacterium]|nr:lysophospholipid acyltransferase family protein [Gemmatimonadaceae bacterium]MCC6432790.1 lysophospholipid acyltransferase family protein [Gemmatimonadaceae bacterium]
MTDSAKVPTLSHRLEYVGTRLAVGALRLLGWRSASWVGGRIAQLAYRPIGIRRGVVERQIAAAFPELTPAQVESMAAASYDSLGRTSIETAVMPGTSREDILARVERVDGWHHVEAGLAQGKGVILVTGHLGNWEFGGAYFAARGVPIDVVARGMANPIFEAYVGRTRRKIGMEVIHDKDAVRRTPRSLRDNRCVAFVSDHDALGLASTFVPFFGRPAKTPRGPAVFALRFAVPVLFVAIVRQPSGKYAVVIEPVPVHPTGDKESDIDTIVLTYTQMLERYVREYPAQYFWQHRRWRRQPPDTPAHLREP